MTEFVNGIRIFAPRGNTPDFVKFSGILTRKELVEFLATKGDEVRFQVKESKKGGYYVEVDNWQPKEKVSKSLFSSNDDDTPF